MKPVTRVIDYVVLVQDNVMAIDDVPVDVKGEVTKWMRYFQGIKDNAATTGMVQETEPVKPAEPEKPVNETEPTTPVNTMVGGLVNNDHAIN